MDEIAEASQEAYLRALRACPVEDEAAIYAWLRRTMDNLLMDRMRLLSHEAPVSDTAGVFVRASDTSADPERELERTEQRRELVALFELVSQQLAPRQRAVLGLYVRGVSVGSGRRPCRLASVVSPQPEVAAPPGRCRPPGHAAWAVATFAWALERAKVRLVTRCGSLYPGMGTV